MPAHGEPGDERTAHAAPLDGLSDVSTEVEASQLPRPQVWVSWRALVVWEALCRLAGEKSTWRGRQRELARESQYALRTVQLAVEELKAERLVEVDRRGNEYSYRLPRYVDVRAESPSQPLTGRDVILEAGSGASRARAEATATAAAGAAATTAVESGAAAATPPIAAATPSDLASPTYSSSSSSIAAAAAAPAAAPPPRGPMANTATTLTPAEAGARARLVAMGIDPRQDIVTRIAGLGPWQEREVWRRVEYYEGHTPDYVERTLDTVERLYGTGADEPGLHELGELLPSEEAKQEAAGVVDRELESLARAVDDAQHLTDSPSPAFTVRPLQGARRLSPAELAELGQRLVSAFVRSLVRPRSTRTPRSRSAREGQNRGG